MACHDGWMQSDAARDHKIEAILCVRIGYTVVSIDRCGAAERPIGGQMQAGRVPP